MSNTYDDLLDKMEKGTINQRAAYTLICGMQIDGGHHKQWYMDQALRILAGDMYGEIVRLYEEPQPGEDVPDTTFYQWDKGIAP